MSVLANTVRRLEELETQAQDKTTELDAMTERIDQLGQEKETLSA